MGKTNPNTEKVSEDGVTGRFCPRQSKLSKFIHKKENPVRRCEDINNDVFGLVLQGKTELFANFLKDLYYICVINFQKNGSGVQYTINNLPNPTLSAPTDPAFEAVKTALTMVQKGILDAKIRKFVDREKILGENPKRAFTILHGQCTEGILTKLGGGSD